jgi:uncharacterized membrane protein YphA (DoxX/SURF4 family)
MKAYGNLPRLENFEPYRPSAAALRIARERHVELPDTLSQAQRTISWICCLIAAAIMIETLFYKFTGAAESKYIFHKMGTEPWWRWGQGIWELLASLGLLIPRLRWAGGILTTGAMLAAILSHMTWLGYSILGDHGLLFGMALVTFTSGFTVMILHRHEIPFVTPLSYW